MAHICVSIKCRLHANFVTPSCLFVITERLYSLWTSKLAE